ncbi:MAG: hypothetical protein JJ966_04210 [Balneolaceae bacterium]|nr:hypothetical protein [Balneolaceae bacterium]
MLEISISANNDIPSTMGEVKNMNTGETKQIKWKHAKRMVDQEGWVLVEN